MSETRQSSAQQIIIVKGTGSATTELAAFDAALVDCGLGNYNLIRLSSVLPPYAQVISAETWDQPQEHWGHKLYVVYAFGEAIQPGSQVWAGIGWVVVDKESGAGLFVEHDAKTKAACRQLISDSLDGLCKNRGLIPDDYEKHMVFSGTTCHNEPAGTIVAAVYGAEGWQ